MKRNYLLFSWLLAGILFISSCKQDTIYSDIVPNTDRIIVEFADAKNIQNVTMDYSTDPIEVDLAELRFMVRSYVPNNVTVRITSSADVVDDYNSDNGTTYTPVPAGVFAFEPNEIVLTPTERKKKVRIRIRSSDIATGQYAIGLSIAEVSAGEISQVAGTIVIAVSVKNKYDGYYETKGAAFHPTYGNYVWNSEGVYACGNAFSLVTTGANSVILDPGQPLQNGSVLSFFSAVLPSFTVNPVTNKVTVTTTNSTVFIDYSASYDNHYDPATKTFYVKYGWSDNRVATDTFTYCGPR